MQPATLPPRRGDGHVDRGDHEAGLHAGIDGPTDDPVGEHVLDRAAVQLAFVGPVLGDVRDPDLVRGIGGEVPAHQVIVGRRTGLGPLVPLGFAEPGPPAVVPTDPPHHPVRYVGVVAETDLIGEEPIPELGIIAMRVEDRVREVGLLELGVGDRFFEPPVELLATQLEDPARHRDGDPVDGQLTDEREHHFPGRFAWDR
jgi:hypothetical protein